MKDKRITKIVVAAIKETRPEFFQFTRKNAYTDDVGNPISVREDGICWESAEWVDYLLLDKINDEIERLYPHLEVVVEYSNSYEVTVEPL